MFAKINNYSLPQFFEFRRIDLIRMIKIMDTENSKIIPLSLKQKKEK